MTLPFLNLPLAYPYEIGDIGTSIQTKLLRVLQEKEVKPLGDTKVVKVDARIIASTNRNLKQKIAEHLKLFTIDPDNFR